MNLDENVILLYYDDVSDIMSSAMSGICYWCDDIVPSDYENDIPIEEMLKNDITLNFHDIESDKFYSMNLDDFYNGYHKWVEGDYDKYNALSVTNNVITVDCSLIDSICADEIIQLGLFGEVKYA